MSGRSAGPFAKVIEEFLLKNLKIPSLSWKRLPFFFVDPRVGRVAGSVKGFGIAGWVQFC